MTDENLKQLSEVDKLIILLAGAKESEPIPSSLHLQKEMYFLQNLFPDMAVKTDYKPGLMGQHSEVVEEELKKLQLYGLIRSVRGSIGLTSDGATLLAKLKEKSDENEIKKAEEFKDIFNGMTKDELLVFVCFSDPDENKIIEESAQYKRVVQNRMRLAVSMCRKDKISAQKAAYIAGKTFEDFFAELKTYCR